MLDFAHRRCHSEDVHCPREVAQAAHGDTTMPHSHALIGAASTAKKVPLKTAARPPKGLFKAAELAEIRKKIGLTHRQAGDLIGAPAREIQRYEAGEAAAPLALCNILRLLLNNPNRLAEITPTRGRTQKLLNLRDLERLQCEEALRLTGGVGGAAELLGITRHAMRRRIVKHEIHWPLRHLG